MKGIYKFEADCGRMGYLDGLFVADDKNILNLIGHEIYFGEVLGKHSDISVKIDDENITLISDNQADVEVVERLRLETGYNPLIYDKIN